MHAARTWWRELGGLLAAAVIVMLAIGPSMDALICSGEGIPEVSVSVAATAPMAIAKDQADLSGDQHTGVPGHSDRGACPHGHCHHGSVAKAALEAPSLGVLKVADRLPIPLTTVPISDLRYSLDRPPRA
jgi:hypothetical protein